MAGVRTFSFVYNTLARGGSQMQEPKCTCPHACFSKCEPFRGSIGLPIQADRCVATFGGNGAANGKAAIVRASYDVNLNSQSCNPCRAH